MSFSKPLCAADCGRDGILRCARCLDTYYCTKECQAKMWQQHKGPCKEKAAARAKAESDNAAAEAKTKAEADDIQTLCSAADCKKIALERCSLCAGAKYCGRKCQKKHWPEHKELCKMAVEVRNKIGDTIEVVDKKIEEYKRGAEAGYADAQFNLGLCYLNGTGVTVDLREMIKWYTLAAEGGQMDAQFNLGQCYQEGTGVDVDAKMAFHWFTLAAEAGQASAQFNLGCYYFSGIGGAVVDKKKAVMLYKSAAEAGNIDAQAALGKSYFVGDGNEVDRREGLKWLTRAAEAGSAKAQKGLSIISNGIIHKNGAGDITAIN